MRQYPVFIRVEDRFPESIKITLQAVGLVIVAVLAGGFIGDAMVVYADPILAFWDTIKSLIFLAFVV